MRETPRQRSARGERRRQTLVKVAAELVIERGIAAVNHRAVADRAGLPLAATTYYFASLAELVEAAVAVAADRWLRGAQDVVADLPSVLEDPDVVARAVVAVVAGISGDSASSEAGDLAVLYDRYLEAGRLEHLRPAVSAYNERLDGLLGEVLSRAGLRPGRDTARALLALVDGAVLRALAEGDDPAPRARRAVAAFVRLLSAAGES